MRQKRFNNDHNIWRSNTQPHTFSVRMMKEFCNCKGLDEFAQKKKLSNHYGGPTSLKNIPQHPQQQLHQHKNKKLFSVIFSYSLLVPSFVKPSYRRAFLFTQFLSTVMMLKLTDFFTTWLRPREGGTITSPRRDNQSINQAHGK